MSQQNQAVNADLPPVTQEDITRVLGPYCFIRLDNGDEAFFINGHFIGSAEGAQNDPPVYDIACLAARAAWQSLRCFELPVPAMPDWCWGDILEQLARKAPTGEVSGTVNPDVRFAFRDWTIFAPRFQESTLASRRGLDVWRRQGAQAYMTYHNGIYHTGHNEGKLNAADIDEVAKAAGVTDKSGAYDSKSDAVIRNNDALAEMLGLTGTPGIIVMPVENATEANTTVIPGVVSEAVMEQAIKKAAGN